jgi:hypothetical protein
MKITIDNRDEIIPRMRYPYTIKPPRGAHLLTAWQIKAIGRVNPAWALFLEVTPPGEDRSLKDGDLLTIRGGERFYTVPPATAG